MNTTLRFARLGLSFPSECVRCGDKHSEATTLLSLRRTRWLRSKPRIEVPICRRCWTRRKIVSGISGVVLIGIGILAVPQFSHYRPAFLQQVHVPGWMVRCIAPILAGLEFFLTFFSDPLVSLRAQIADFSDDWIDLTSDDAAYLARIQSASAQPFAFSR